MEPASSINRLQAYLRHGAQQQSHTVHVSAECFIDTNLFIYQLEASEERKAATADRIIRKGIETLHRLHQ